MPENVPPYSQPMPPYPPNYRPGRRSSWWIPFVVIGVILAIIIIFFVALFSIIGNALSFETEEVKVSSNSALHLKMANMPEIETSNPFAVFAGGSFQATFTETLEAIKRAKNDSRIKGILINPGGGTSFAKAVELNKALMDFKRSGKFIYAHMDIADERQLFSCLPADSIFMPVEGIAMINGFGVSSVFLKGLMDEIGVNFHVESFEEFKTAAESLTSKKFSESSKLQLRALINQQYQTFLDGLANRRKMNRAQAQSAVNEGVYSVQDLKDKGFIDAFATENQVKELMKKRILGGKTGKELTLISAGRYIEGDYNEKGNKVAEGKRIAIIYGEGSINSGGPESPFMMNENEIRSNQFVKYLREARDDKDIKAVILRINSPGGTVIASDEIYQEVLKLKAKKPVYASMGDVAASGGYYISMGCDTIVAHPETITGSIGVIAMIPNVSGLLKKIYLDADTISVSPNAQFMNPMFAFREADLQKLHLYAKQTYDRFVSKVAQNRKMTFEQTRALAKGRVWTGADAKARGLVDELGGLQTAIDIAKRRIGVKTGEKVKVEIYPKKEEGIEAFVKLFTHSDGDEEISIVEKLASRLSVTPEKMLTDWKRLPESTRKQISYSYKLMDLSKNGGSLYALPYLPVIE